MFNLFLAVSPEIFIINATSILLIHGVVFSTSKKYDYPPRDNFTYFCQILLLLSTAGTISMCFDSFEQERFDAFEFIVLIPLPTRSMLFMISAHDSIAMYLAIEPQSLCFYATKKGPDTSTRGATSWFTKPRPSVTRSPSPKGSSAQLLTPPGIVLSEPSQEWPLVDTHHFSPGPERLGHRNLDHLRAGKRKTPRPDQRKQQCRIRPPLALKEFTRGHQLSENKGGSAAYCEKWCWLKKGGRGELWDTLTSAFLFRLSRLSIALFSGEE
ncbi:hypothetical protein E1A91_D04G095800v1 [Gossypium mustelinum]|uniref:NADH:quinone oxidoreductase/Mrp antiporter membrane subunit domain-containing protein n=1 Tax=Gossypium mustelinum TaxID=34275 RepID=A0A5D2VBY7_GOSMU|nr:hypothetical protein E1A91_D04G095800v1 [Gossypium mustelinum]